jgi:hypothetical protein
MAFHMGYLKVRLIIARIPSHVLEQLPYIKYVKQAEYFPYFEPRKDRHDTGNAFTRGQSQSVLRLAKAHPSALNSGDTVIWEYHRTANYQTRKMLVLIKINC